MKTLADRTQAFFNRPQAYEAYTKQENRVIAPGLLKLKSRLRAARRFTLDDAFVREAVRAAAVMPDSILRRADLARLPFDNVWLEWSQRARVLAQAEIGTSQPPAGDEQHMGGALLYASPGKSEEWIAHNFVDNAEDLEPMMLMVTHALSPNPPLNDTPLHQEDKTIMSSGWGYTRNPNRAYSEAEWAALIGRLFERGCSMPDLVALAPLIAFWEKNHASARARKGWTVFEATTREETGGLRFLVTVLAMLNCTPVRYVHQPAAGRFTRRLHSMDYLDTHTVTIYAGRAKVVSILERAAKAEAAARKRAHEVRGFWRVERSSAWRPCVHEPNEVHGKHAHCSRCGKTLVWVEHHMRGDASLGFVKKDYEVTR